MGEKLIKEGNGKLFLDERSLCPDGKFVTVNIVVNPEYLRANPEVIKKFLEAHVNETQWINSHKEEALKTFNTELKRLTGQSIPDDQIKEAFSRLELTYDPLQDTLIKSANDAFDIGFLGKTRPNLTDIFELNILNQVLKEKGLQTVGEGQNQPLTASNESSTNVTAKLDIGPTYANVVNGGVGDQ